MKERGRLAFMISSLYSSKSGCDNLIVVLVLSTVLSSGRSLVPLWPAGSAQGCGTACGVRIAARFSVPSWTWTIVTCFSGIWTPGAKLSVPVTP